MGTHEATNAANAEAARAAGWPELTGFDRQIPWAITIRADKMRAFDAEVDEASMSDADRSSGRRFFARPKPANGSIAALTLGRR
ncbi:hypothetical protein ACQPZ2_00655 [Nocardia pseudovaccinii]|uniref:hypothetical protein n=1 Tax=Nocardia pseudovaccinii TaxID=189540 RepID=UPI003D8C4808